MFAALHNAVKNVRTLLQHNADVEIRGWENKTALEWAKEKNHEEVIELFSFVSFCVFQLEVDKL